MLDNVVFETSNSISGRITDSNTNPVSGVVVSLDTGAIITTTASGYFTFTNVVSGTYTLTPAKHGYTFSPETRQVTVPPSATGQDFTGDPAERNLGFLPNPHGYSFENYGGIHFPDYTIDDMRRMFGDNAVCVTVTPENVCIARPAAIRWYVRVNRAMDGGHCEGMAVTSLRFFKGLDDPADFQSGASTTYDLTLENARRNIAYYFVYQFTIPLYTVGIQATIKTPGETLDQLITAMSGTADNPTTLFFIRRGPRGLEGHTVTPYKIEYQGNDIWWIYVYDSNDENDPGLGHHAIIDMNTNTWSYDMGSLGIWGTDPNYPYTLGAIALSWWSFPPAICHWCTGGPLSPSTGSSIGQIWHTGAGHALITDSQGRQLGFSNDQYVSEIPGAGGSVPLGGLGIPQEPIYSLPLTDIYTILLDGQTITETGTVSVTQFGPGYAVSIEDATIAPTSQDQLIIASDGTQIAYEATDANEATLTLALEGDTQSNQMSVQGADIGAGQVVTMTADTTAGQMIFNNSEADGGAYNIDFTRVDSSGEKVFTHASITILATDTHYLNYGAWDGFGSMTLEIDHGSDGTIDEVIELKNESLNWIYLPVMVR